LGFEDEGSGLVGFMDDGERGRSWERQFWMV